MSFKVGIYCGTGNANSLGVRVKAGFERHGITDAIILDKTNIVPCDLAVFWGHKKKAIIATQKKAGADYLVMERAYMGDRFNWVSLGFNGLNGHAEFFNKNSPSDRWDKHWGDEWLKPWKPKGSGGYILLIGQVARDANVRKVQIHSWLATMSQKIKRAYKGRMVVLFRPHPDDVRKNRVRPVKLAKLSKHRTLDEDLAGAEACVIYNSNTGVNAVMAGVPLLAADKGSMAYEMATHDLKETFIRPDRTQWAYDMAYAQWLPEEIENGDAWAHLKRKYE